MPVYEQIKNNRSGTAAGRDLDALKARGGPFVEAVEATRTPMLVTDAQKPGNPIVYANPAFLKLLGYEPGEVEGRDFVSIAGEPADPGTKARMEAALAAPGKTIDDLLLRAKDGREVWVSQAVDPIRREGRTAWHFASFYDITDRVRRGQALDEERGTLERRVAARTRRLQQAKERLEEEVERRRRTEATLRDALAQGQEDLRFRDFLVREVNHRTLCCRDRWYGRGEPCPCPGSHDADVLRASQVEHAVQHVGGDRHLGRLAPVRLEA